jgi:hypothetical protein
MEKEDLSVREVQRIKKLLRWEMLEIFYGRNMNKLPKFMD